MNRSWTICALACLSSILAVIVSFYLFFSLFFLFIIYLLYQGQMKLIHFLFYGLCFSFFYWYIPVDDPLQGERHHLPYETKVKGKVIDSVRYTDRTIQFTLMDEVTDDKILAIYFLQNDTDGKKEAGWETIHTYIAYGSLCTVSGMKDLPSEATNPYEFDYRKYLLQQGIIYQLSIDDLASVTCHEPHFIHYVNNYREWLMLEMKVTYGERIYPWLLALVFGDDSYISPEVIELFQRWGLSHILAISGLHVGIIVSLIYFVCIRFSILTVERTEWFIMFFLPIYALLAGGAPSVWRAAGMIMIFFLMKKWRRNLSSVDIFSIVFISLILFDKWIVYHVGFQLSFIVTIGLLLSSDIFRRSKSKLFSLFQISFIAQSMIIPLQIHYFHEFNPLSIILNIIIVPYFSLFVIPFMFFLSISVWLPALIQGGLVTLFASIHEYVIACLFYIDQWAYYPFIIGEIPLIAGSFYYLLLILFYMSLEGKHVYKQCIYGFSIVILLVSIKLLPYVDSRVIVTMLDIGQGDAIVIELPYRRAVIFIDAGATVSFDSNEPSDRVYRQIIRPFLRGRSIDAIDMVFVSHEHLDHIGSLPFLKEEFAINHMYTSLFYVDDLFDHEKDPLFTALPAGSYMKEDDFTLTVLSPKNDFHDVNANSLVLYIEMKGIGFLFTGDATEATEEQIIKGTANLQVDVLKVGHHGSNTSTSSRLLDQVKPKLALIPVGRNNRYNHPHVEVLETLEERDVIIYRTDKDGAIQLFIDDKGLWIESFLQDKKD